MACPRALRARVPYVPTCPRARVPYVPACPRARVPYVPACPRARVPYVPTCPRARVPYVPTCPRAHVPFLACLFWRAFFWQPFLTNHLSGIPLIIYYIQGIWLERYILSDNIMSAFMRVDSAFMSVKQLLECRVICCCYLWCVRLFACANLSEHRW